jgi:tetratricopeptide (TPR) repeat protein
MLAGEEGNMPGEGTHRLHGSLWGGLAVGSVAAVALLLVLMRPHAQGPARGPQPLLAEPTAARIDDYLAQAHAGVAAYRAQRYAKAMQAFEAASALQPSEYLPYRYLAEIYWRQERKAEALSAVRSLAAVRPDVYFLDHQGMAYEESGLKELAMQLYQEALRLDSRYPSAHYNLGRAYLEAGDLEGGIAEMQEALRLHPNFPEAHQALGMAYTEQRRFEEAIVHLQQALVLRPELTVVRNHLGRLYLALGRLDEAIQTFRALVEHAPDVAEARRNLAVAYARKGLRELAIDQFQEALRRRPDFHAARTDLATLLLEMRRPQDAIDTLQAALAAPTRTPGESEQRDRIELRYRLGIAYEMAGQPREAIRELEAVLRAQPAHAGAHANLGRLCYQIQQFDRAWRHARRAEALGVPVAELIAALRRVSTEPP